MPEEQSKYTDMTTPADWLCAHCNQPRQSHTCLAGFARKEVKFAGMLRIKNEEPWIAEVIESIRDLCDVIYVLDDHSTDRTAEICMRYAPQLHLLPSPFIGMDESRDKNWLYDQIVRECKPEWIVCIDGDEVLEKNGPEAIRKHVEAHPTIDSYKLKIEYMWNGRDLVRTDRIYGDFWRPSMFRPFHPDPDKPDDLKVMNEFRFMATPFGRQRGNDKPNLHCSSVPQRRIHGAGRMPARLKHYGYMTRQNRVAKLDYYTSIDWKNLAEDCYRHMCQGDTVTIQELPRIQELMRDGLLVQADVDFLTNVKPSDRLVHAGPIQVDRWDENKPWSLSHWAQTNA